MTASTAGFNFCNSSSRTGANGRATAAEPVATLPGATLGRGTESRFGRNSNSIAPPTITGQRRLGVAAKRASSVSTASPTSPVALEKVVFLTGNAV
jgi:hypothetical protein